ncbi:MULTISPECIES: hypothetical protein [unclassified Brachybacterium]|uniref:hypothetical protein n=1 Tax=unclassified Brachybacterium TaxID=2623841 RepID=UPI003F8D9B14
MANALDKARQALEAARGKINEWDHAIEQARADRAKAEQAAPADPAELDQYADTYSRAAGKIRAAEQGRKVAAAAEVNALEDVVRAGLEDAKAELRTAQKAHAEHRRKLDALLGKVSELDGADYRPVTLDDLDRLERTPGASVKASRAASLQGAVWDHEASVNRMTGALDRGEVPPAERGNVPAYVLEYVDARRNAGLPTAAETQRAAAIEQERAEAEQEPEEPTYGWNVRARLGAAR